MREIVANGLRFACQDEGDGTPVILLHGFPDTSDLWRHQIPALSAAGFRAIAPDMRGRGDSDKPANVPDYALSHIVRDVAGLMDTLGIERAHVVGHDWGAAVAWFVAALLPERVERLVAISVGHPGTNGAPNLDDLQKGWYRLLFQFEGVAEELLQQDDWYLLRVLADGARDTERYVQILSAPGALTPALNWYRANLPLRRLLGTPPALPHVAAPTMGVFGAKDGYMGEYRMRQSGEFVSGPWRYECFADAGHWIPLDEPDRLNALLLEFLRG